MASLKYGKYIEKLIPCSTPSAGPELIIVISTVYISKQGDRVRVILTKVSLFAVEHCMYREEAVKSSTNKNNH